jgi:hypothetical protein
MRNRIQGAQPHAPEHLATHEQVGSEIGADSHQRLRAAGHATVGEPDDAASEQPDEVAEPDLALEVAVGQPDLARRLAELVEILERAPDAAIDAEAGTHRPHPTVAETHRQHALRLPGHVVTTKPVVVGVVGPQARSGCGQLWRARRRRLEDLELERLRRIVSDGHRLAIRSSRLHEILERRQHHAVARQGHAEVPAPRGRHR